MTAAAPDAMGAIVMAESWFEHRAVSTSRSGNRDLGLGQASDWARSTLHRLHQEGAIDFAPADDADYLDPWHAMRMVAVWFELMLHETNGDLDAAVRAHHAGSAAARLGEAEDYLANVTRKRRRFMRHEDSTPTWRSLAAQLSSPDGTQTAGSPLRSTRTRAGTGSRSAVRRMPCVQQTAGTTQSPL